MNKVKATTILALFVLTPLVAVDSWGESINPPFSASCECVAAHGYREGTDLLGKPMAGSWSTDERFFSKWKFIYSGGKSIIIDEKEAAILVQHPGVIIAGDPGTTGTGSGIWTYAIHLGLQKIVACQVNAHGHATDKAKGVKARTVNLNCDFEMHRTDR